MENTPIQMICAADTSGRITPLRFRFESPEHAIETVRIENVISRNELNYVGIREKQFICTAPIGGRLETLEIRCNTESQKWRIFRFLP